jgi:hypothetical protein
MGLHQGHQGRHHRHVVLLHLLTGEQDFIIHNLKLASPGHTHRLGRGPRFSAEPIVTRPSRHHCILKLLGEMEDEVLEVAMDGISCERVAQDFLDDEPESTNTYQPSCFQQPESSEEEVPAYLCCDVFYLTSLKWRVQTRLVL